MATKKGKAFQAEVTRSAKGIGGENTKHIEEGTGILAIDHDGPKGVG